LTLRAMQLLRGSLPGIPMSVADFMAIYAKFISEHYGDRCDTAERGCPLCEMWALYDLTEVMVGWDD
jgi:hypothetical protein